MKKKTRRSKYLLEAKVSKRGKAGWEPFPGHKGVADALSSWCWWPHLKDFFVVRMSLVTGIRVKCGSANRYKEFGKSERDREERLGR